MLLKLVHYFAAGLMRSADHEDDPLPPVHVPLLRWLAHLVSVFLVALAFPFILLDWMIAEEGDRWLLEDLPRPYAILAFGLFYWVYLLVTLFIPSWSPAGVELSVTVCVLSALLGLGMWRFPNRWVGLAWYTSLIAFLAFLPMIRYRTLFCSSPLTGLLCLAVPYGVGWFVPVVSRRVRDLLLGTYRIYRPALWRIVRRLELVWLSAAVWGVARLFAGALPTTADYVIAVFGTSVFFALALMWTLLTAAAFSVHGAEIDDRVVRATVASRG
jgi:hypothetical protein